MDETKIRQAVRLFLEAIGEDPDRDGIKRTPDRVARMCRELFYGLKTDPADLLNTIEEKHDEVILVKDVPFYSICEHHLLPFKGVCHVAYVPDNRVTGLSKIVRLVECCAARLQVQERLTTQIAEALQNRLQPKGVLVIIEAEHLCMTMRGVRKPGSKMVTSVVRGLFRRNEKTRYETLSLIYGNSSRPSL